MTKIGHFFAGFGLESLSRLSGTIAVAGTLLYILSFAFGAGPITGLMIPELNAARVRGKFYCIKLFLGFPGFMPYYVSILMQC